MVRASRALLFRVGFGLGLSKECVEVAYFGLLPRFIGQGLGGHLLTAAVERAWQRGAKRVWLHTCDLDHPAALPHYQARGFRPYKFAIEVSDDPRLTGHLPVTAGGHVPLIRPPVPRW